MGSFLFSEACPCVCPAGGGRLRRGSHHRLGPAGALLCGDAMGRILRCCADVHPDSSGRLTAEQVVFYYHHESVHADQALGGTRRRSPTYGQDVSSFPDRTNRTLGGSWSRDRVPVAWRSGGATLGTSRRTLEDLARRRGRAAAAGRRRVDRVPLAVLECAGHRLADGVEQTRSPSLRYNGSGTRPDRSAGTCCRLGKKRTLNDHGRPRCLSLLADNSSLDHRKRQPGCPLDVN